MCGPLQIINKVLLIVTFNQQLRHSQSGIQLLNGFTSLWPLFASIYLYCLPPEVIRDEREEVGVVALSFQPARLILTITHNNTPHLALLTLPRSQRLPRKYAEIYSYRTLKPVLRV